MEVVDIYQLLKEVMQDSSQGIHPMPLYSLVENYVQNESDCTIYYLLAFYHARNIQNKPTHSMVQMDIKDIENMIECKWMAVDIYYDTRKLDEKKLECQAYKEELQNHKGTAWMMGDVSFKKIIVISRQKYGVGVLNLTDWGYIELKRYISFTVFDRTKLTYLSYKDDEERPKIFGAPQWEKYRSQSSFLSPLIIELYKLEPQYIISNIKKLSNNAARLWNVIMIVVISSYIGQWRRANDNDTNDRYSWKWINKSG